MSVSVLGAVLFKGEEEVRRMTLSTCVRAKKMVSVCSLGDSAGCAVS